MLGVSDRVAANMEAHQKIPPIYGDAYKVGDSLESAEGGFRKGGRIAIDDPDSHFYNMGGVCGDVPSERTVYVTLANGVTSRWCVTSLRRA